MSDATSFGSPSKPKFRKLVDPRFWFGGNWKKLIKTSELPAEIQLLIGQVVSKSRLMRREKFDVAEELVQHFQDGHRGGLSFEQLQHNFGDPESAAMLIRRSKIRNRSLWVSAARMIPPTIACLSIAYLILLWHYHNGHSIATVDYTAELNRSATEAQEADKAWPLYRPVWIKYQFNEGGSGKYVDMRKQMFVQPSKESRACRLAHPIDEQWPQVVSMLQQHAELLDVFREGAKRNSFGIALQPDARNYSDEDFAALIPHTEKETFKNWLYEEDHDEILDGAMIGILLLHVQKMRDAARLFHLDTRLAITEGDPERVVANIETVLGLANQVAETPIAVNALVAVAVSHVGLYQLEEVITSNADFFSAAQLARLQATLERTNIHSWLSYTGGRLAVKDLVQRCYTDDGNGDGRMTAEGMRFLNSDFFAPICGLSGDGDNVSSDAAPPHDIDWSKELWSILTQSELAKSGWNPTSVFTCATRKEVLAKADDIFEEVEADMKLPFWESKHSKVGGWKELEQFFDENQSEHILLSTTSTSVNYLRPTMERGVARKNGVALALAMYRYHKATGKWPHSIDDLTDAYLSKPPIDILTGKPLHFKIDQDQPLIYSIGMDHDDDGGVDAKMKDNSIERSGICPGPKSDDFEGDWILWPQVEPIEN